MVIFINFFLFTFVFIIYNIYIIPLIIIALVAIPVKIYSSTNYDLTSSKIVKKIIQPLIWAFSLLPEKQK